MALYAGIDLHSNNSVVVVQDDKRVARLSRRNRIFRGDEGWAVR